MEKIKEKDAKIKELTAAAATEAPKENGVKAEAEAEA